MRNKKHSPLKRPIALFFVLTMLSITLISCNLPGGSSTSTGESTSGDTMATAVVQTFVAQTVAAAQGSDQAGEAAVEPPADEPAAEIPSETPTLEFTATATLSPTPSDTPTPEVPMVTVSEATNCRVGPGKFYDLVGFLMVGEETEIVARDPSGYYWYVRNPDKPGGFCWLWGNYATTTGNTASLPVFTPPPTPTLTFTPTPQPDFTVIFNDVENCGPGVWHIDFRITNTGSLTFESVSTTVTDNHVPQTVTYTKDEFEEFNACILNLGTLQSDLAPTEVGFTTSDTLANNPAGHNITAAITLCTNNALGGTCITKSFNFTP